MPKRTKTDYALLWANGASFGEVYDLMKEDLRGRLRDPEAVMPLSTQGSCCGHNLNHHMGEGRGRYLRPCLVCTCPAFTPDKED